MLRGTNKSVQDLNYKYLNNFLRGQGFVHSFPWLSTPSKPGITSLCRGAAGGGPAGDLSDVAGDAERHERALRGSPGRLLIIKFWTSCMDWELTSTTIWCCSRSPDHFVMRSLRLLPILSTSGILYLKVGKRHRIVTGCRGGSPLWCLIRLRRLNAFIIRTFHQNGVSRCSVLSSSESGASVS